MADHKSQARNRRILGLIGLLGFFSLFAQEIHTLPDGHLHTYILDVGQGDSILLVSPSGKQILVDGGPDLSALQGIGNHMSFFDRTIELLILTHPDLDHIAALPEIVERYKVGAILLSGIDTPQPQYQRLLARIAKQKIPVIIADPGKDIVFEDGLILDVVWPPRNTFGIQPKKVNDTSVVLRAIYGSSSILLTGDIEEPAERAILKTGADLQSTILKIAHHGSRTSTSTGFLLAVHPEAAVISVGKDNMFGHPHWAVMERLKRQRMRIQRTDQEGEISLVLP
ncbi:hypothetical protein A3C37_05265 [Candidatus Peribacteria bacterium RIFCSPHIGHO2_02_FULL_53_20]|nr:MAG: hypothetical protein A3C37_05265 [Candidatus Peribacteria bacterium RIFCSPHIGHO2_02_FULL_53_20]OGJ70767.1 MAG: hypothetical protein A3G69_00770 [Candidatus Peribacteria bacterium RIFCSPLOWO2_12_FULL_53_10]